MWYVSRNAGAGTVELWSLDTNKSGELAYHCELPEGTASLDVAPNGTVYLANPERGTLQIYADAELRNLAGVDGEQAFIDGSAPLFYTPMRVKYAENALYVWDFNVVRKLTLDGSVAASCITLAGEASPTFELEPGSERQPAESIVLPNSKLAEFALLPDGSLLISDPKRGILWRVE